MCLDQVVQMLHLMLFTDFALHQAGSCSHSCRKVQPLLIQNQGFKEAICYSAQAKGICSPSGLQTDSNQAHKRIQPVCN